MSITYPARSSATAELALPPTAYRDAYSNHMLTDHTSAMTTSKKPDLDEPTLRIAQRMLSMPPKPHDEMKLGKPRNPQHAKPRRKKR